MYSVLYFSCYILQEGGLTSLEQWQVHDTAINNSPLFSLTQKAGNMNQTSELEEKPLTWPLKICPEAVRHEWEISNAGW
jgi:hypothetical protein